MSMLDCKKIQPMLSEYLDGTLPDSESWDVQMHLASCAVCTRASAELAATVRLVSSLPERGPSESFDDRLAARLANIVLTPKPQTFREKLAEFWQRPAARPAVASGLAATALAATCLVMLRPTVTQTPVSEDAMLTQMVREHADFASAEPLANPSDLLSDTLESEGL